MVLRGEVSLRRSLLVRATMEVGGGSESLLVSTMLPPLHGSTHSPGVSFLYQAPASQTPTPPPPVSLTLPYTSFRSSEDPLSGRWIAT